MGKHYANFTGYEFVDESAQAFQQQSLAVVLAFFVIAVWADVGTESVCVAQFLEQGDDMVFDGGFVHESEDLIFLL